MPKFMAGERDAGLGVAGGGLFLGNPTQIHSSVPHQVFNDSPETMRLDCHYDPSPSTGELYAPPGEEMDN